MRGEGKRGEGGTDGRGKEGTIGTRGEGRRGRGGERGGQRGKVPASEGRELVGQ